MQLINHIVMKAVYESPQTYLLEMSAEGSVMLAQSDYDEKHNTEKLGWDEVIDL